MRRPLVPPRSDIVEELVDQPEQLLHDLLFVLLGPRLRTAPVWHEAMQRDCPP